MKKVVNYFLIAAFLLCSQGLRAQSDPGAYMDNMTQELNQFSDDMFEYLSSVAHDRSARKTEKRRRELISTAQNGKKKVQKMDAYEGDAALRDSVVAFFSITYSMLTDDLNKIVDMEAVAEQSYDAMEAYLLAQEQASERLRATSNMMIQEQKAFAGRHNIKLIDSKDEKSKKLSTANRVFKDYNVVFLLFFKPYKQEIYMLDALNKGDINGLRQNAQALAAAADESMARLDTVKPYLNDKSVVVACKEMMKFYKEEGAEKSQALVNFLVQKDNFDKIKASFESIPQNKRTQADVDKYNAAINDFNKSLEAYNKTNEELNKKRQMGLDKWNKAGPAFLARHVPKKQ